MMAWSSYNNDERSDEKANENNEQVPTVDDFLKESERDFFTEHTSNKVKRSLESVERYPLEDTYRPPIDEVVTRTPRSLPGMSSMPSLPDMSSLPSMPDKSSLPSMPDMSSMPSMPSKPSIPSAPTMPSVPSLAQPPTMPSSEAKINSETNYAMTTPRDVEVIETTTEDYGDIGEPNCEYDVLTFILKCGLNLITSIFGLTDACCTSIF